MSARWWTLVIWALVAGSALYWGFKLAGRPLPVPAQALVAEPGAALRGDLSRLLGAAAPAPVAPAMPEPAGDARFTLIGVVNPKAAQAAREGLALIAVDGKPPRAYRVGAVIEGTHVLKSVSARGATLGLKEGNGVVALSIPAPAEAATGSLPAAAAPTPGMPRAAALPRTALPFPPAPAAPRAGPGLPQLPEAPQAVQPESQGGAGAATN